MSASLKSRHDLVQSFHRGEEKGFEFIFNEIYPAILYFAWHMINNREQAEDIAQMAFIDLHNHHKQLSNYRKIKVRLYTFAHKQCLFKLLSSTTPTDNDLQLSIHDIIRAEVICELYNSIQILPSHLQPIFRKIYIQGKSILTVATEMGLSDNTVKEFQDQGISLLRRYFTPE